MLYQGDAAKYQIADRMREAERSRVASEALADRKRDGGLNGRWIRPTLLAVVTWPLRQLTRLAGGRGARAGVAGPRLRELATRSCEPPLA
jgi:hypothetical protein